MQMRPKGPARLVKKSLGPAPHWVMQMMAPAPAPLGYANKAPCGPAPASATESARSGKSGGPGFFSLSACLTSDLSDCSAAPGPSRGSEGSGGGGLDRVREKRGRPLFLARGLPILDTQVHTMDVGLSDPFPAGPLRRGGQLGGGEAAI